MWCIFNFHLKAYSTAPLYGMWNEVAFNSREVRTANSTSKPQHFHRKLRKQDKTKTIKKTQQIVCELAFLIVGYISSSCLVFCITAWSPKNLWSYTIRKKLKCNIQALPSRFCYDHFGADFMKLIPEILRLQNNFWVVLHILLGLQAFERPEMSRLVVMPQRGVQANLGGPGESVVRQWLRQGGRQCESREKRRLGSGEKGWHAKVSRPVSVERVISHSSPCENWISHRCIQQSKWNLDRAWYLGSTNQCVSRDKYFLECLRICGTTLEK